MQVGKINKADRVCSRVGVILAGLHQIRQGWELCVITKSAPVPLFECNDVCEMPYQIAQIYKREEMIQLLLSSAVHCDEHGVHGSKYAFLHEVGATSFV